MSEQPQEVDQIIVDAVEHVRDRFGALGLRQLIEEAHRELAEAEAALAALAETNDMTAEGRE
jgi:hypothetical protein